MQILNRKGSIKMKDHHAQFDDLKAKIKELVLKRSEDHSSQNLDIVIAGILEQLAEQIHLSGITQEQFAELIEVSVKELGIHYFDTKSKTLKLTEAAKERYVKSKMEQFIKYQSKPE
jgi:septum formation inhibitor MinC